MRFDTMARASAYKVMSVSSTSTFSPLSTAKYSAAVSAISGTSRRSTGGFSVVLTNDTMRSSAPAFSKTDLKYRKSSFVRPMPPRMILSALARRATLAITAL